MSEVEKMESSEKDGNTGTEKELNLTIPPEEAIQQTKIKDQAADAVVPETNYMEVHHHPDLHHKPKPWHEYFLEFLMIFLAVTLGFFAENLRERITESNREKAFAQELYIELKDDSAVATGKILLRLTKEKELDYLNAYFKDSSLTYCLNLFILYL